MTMSNWDFDDIGTFGSERAALDWARRNKIDPRDVILTQTSQGVEASIRRSAENGEPFNDSGNRRRDGFF